MFLLLKIAIALVVTFGAIKVGEHVDIRHSALISSFPTVVALVVLFIFLETGASDGVTAALTISYAIVLFNVWMIAYYLSLRLKPLWSVVVSIFFYLCVAFLFQRFVEGVSLGLFIKYIPLVVVFLVGLLLFKKAKDSGKMGIMPAWLRFFPYVAVPVILLVITFINQKVGPVWAGVFASFPSTALVTTYYFHKSLGVEKTKKNLRHMFFIQAHLLFLGYP